MTDPRVIVLRAAMEALAEKMGTVDGDPIYVLFGTGGEGTLSHTMIAGEIADLRVEAGIDPKPMPPGAMSRAIDAYKQARSRGESPEEIDQIAAGLREDNERS